MLTYACEEDSDDDSSFMLVLDEMERLKNLIINKYKQYMDEKECELLLKKIEFKQAKIMELKKKESEEKERLKKKAEAQRKKDAEVGQLSLFDF